MFDVKPQKRIECKRMLETGYFMLKDFHYFHRPLFIHAVPDLF